MMSLSFMIRQFLTIELDLGARPLAEQHAVTHLDVDRNQLAGFVTAARTNGDDLALRGLFLGGIGNDDAASGFVFGINAFEHDSRGADGISCDPPWLL